MPHQLKLTDFTNEKELIDWSDAKFMASSDPDYPDKLHDVNPRLSERWYVHSKGKDIKKQTKITEQLEKSGTDALSGLSALSIQDVSGKAAKSAADVHKASLGKTHSALAKLNKAIYKAEHALPGLKRKVTSSTFSQMKNGLTEVRNIRDTNLDQLEDVKEMAKDEVEQQEQIEKLSKIMLSLQECHDILNEALAKHGEPPTKKEKIQSPEHAPAGQRVKRQPYSHPNLEPKCQPIFQH